MRFMPILTIAFVYGLVYTLIHKYNPDAFGFKSAIDPFYFSITTMTTVTYGDIVPKTDFAKMVTMSQQLLLFNEVIELLPIKNIK